MVFQSYALYPHLSRLREHRLRPAAEEGAEGRDRPARRRRRRASSASSRSSKRKPRALSGGQRQRVAMGRAIVRQPQAFLMDEPLSNLDAKLRVQMRAEIARLQRDLGVTTIYVTHDQVEAMTMGDRVAVMRKGELQQVDDAAGALRPPGQPLRGRLHRQPGDEHASRRRSSARTAALVADVGSQQHRARRGDARPTRPALRAYEGKTVVLGHPARGSRGRRARPDDAPGRRLRGRGRAARGARLGDHGPLHRRRAARGHRGRAGARARTSGDERPSACTTRARRDDHGRSLRRRSRVSRGEPSRSRSTRARCISSIPRPVSGSTTRSRDERIAR